RKPCCGSRKRIWRWASWRRHRPRPPCWATISRIAVGTKTPTRSCSPGDWSPPRTRATGSAKPSPNWPPASCRSTHRLPDLTPQMASTQFAAPAACCRNKLPLPLITPCTLRRLAQALRRLATSASGAKWKARAVLVRLSIRDIVLIERLDIDFTAGLSVLTGETGAGKSILLDAFALALGARGDAALVRQGAEQGQVTAAVELAPAHPVRALMVENGLAAEDELILRRVQFADGRTRAFANDQPLSAQTLKALGPALVEIHGQHDERALVDAAGHRRLLDAFGGLEAE